MWKNRNIQILADRINRNVRLKIFQFFWCGRWMSLCGRNVAFSVREGRNLIESERMDKKSRCFAFELKTLEKGKKNGMPVAIRTRDLLLRRQTLYPAELRAHTCINLNIVSFNHFAMLIEGKNEKKWILLHFCLGFFWIFADSRGILQQNLFRVKWEF